MVSRHFCSPSTVHQTELVANYSQDRRIVSDRTVKETKSGMKYVHIEGVGVNCKVPYVAYLLNAVLFALCETPRVEYLVWFPMILYPLVTLLTALLTWSWVAIWLFTIFCFPAIILITLGGVYTTKLYAPLLRVPFISAQRTIMTWTAPLWRPVHVYYVPHALSNITSSYNAGTSRVVVESTIQLRLQRLSTLPVPDSHYSQFFAGTTEVGVFVIERQPFFEQALGPP